MSRINAIQKEAKNGNGGSRYDMLDSEILEDLGIEKFVVKGDVDAFISIIPPEDPDVYFAKKLFVHYGIGVNNAAFLCPNMMTGDPCPICEERKKLMDAGEKKEVISELNWTVRFLFFIVDWTDGNTIDEGVKYYLAPKTVNDGVINLSKNKRTGEFIDISNPKDGKVLVFSRKGKGLSTRYVGFSLEDRDDALDDEWLDVIPNFDEVTKVYSAEIIDEEFSGYSPSKNDDEESDTEKTEDNDEKTVEDEGRVSKRANRRVNRNRKSKADNNDSSDKVKSTVEKVKSRLNKNKKK